MGKGHSPGLEELAQGVAEGGGRRGERGIGFVGAGQAIDEGDAGGGRSDEEAFAFVGDDVEGLAGAERTEFEQVESGGVVGATDAALPVTEEPGTDEEEGEDEDEGAGNAEQGEGDVRNGGRGGCGAEGIEGGRGRSGEDEPGEKKEAGREDRGEPPVSR